MSMSSETDRTHAHLVSAERTLERILARIHGGGEEDRASPDATGYLSFMERTGNISEHVRSLVEQVETAVFGESPGASAETAKMAEYGGTLVASADVRPWR